MTISSAPPPPPSAREAMDSYARAKLKELSRDLDELSVHVDHYAKSRDALDKLPADVAALKRLMGRTPDPMSGEPGTGVCGTLHRIDTQLQDAAAARAARLALENERREADERAAKSRDRWIKVAVSVASFFGAVGGALAAIDRFFP